MIEWKSIYTFSSASAYIYIYTYGVSPQGVNIMAVKCPTVRLWLWAVHSNVSLVQPECDLLNSGSAVSLRLPQKAAISFSAPVQAFVSMVIEQAFKWDCKLCFDPPRALETTCHITFISLLNCEMILWLALQFKWCARWVSELTHSTFNLTAVSPPGQLCHPRTDNGS